LGGGGWTVAAGKGGITWTYQSITVLMSLVSCRLK